MLKKGDKGDEVRDLQRNLRQLGYLQRGIDGEFGSGTERAVKGLSHDLLNNFGGSGSGDGHSSVRMVDYNKGRVSAVTGVMDQGLAACISDILADPQIPKLPRSDDPAADNKKITSEIAAMSSAEVPIPFLLAILKQESNLCHFNVPGQGDDDSYIVVGLDTNASENFIITSRGYGAGQYTLFHHPPRQDEVDDFMLDIGKNLGKAIQELRGKFDHFIIGATSGAKADDRIAEAGPGPLRLCKFSTADPLYMKACKQCLKDAGTRDIREGVTPFYQGSTERYLPTQYYRNASYSAVPIRKNIGCDWPYAVRRYNGSGINSYHYQTKILLHLSSLDMI